MAAFYRTNVQSGSAPTGFSQVYSGNGASHVITGLSSGDWIVFICGGGSGSKYSYNRYDGATCTGGTISKLGNLYNSGSAYAANTYYQIKVTSTSITVSTPNSPYVKAYKLTY